MIAEALRLLRIRKGLTQAAASKLEGAPDCRTLSHWETRRKSPSYGLLRSYLTSLDLDFRDFQGALEQVEGTAPKRLQDGLEKLEQRLDKVERNLDKVERHLRQEPAARDPEAIPARRRGRKPTSRVIVNG